MNLTRLCYSLFPTCIQPIRTASLDRTSQFSYARGTRGRSPLTLVKRVLGRDTHGYRIDTTA